MREIEIAKLIDSVFKMYDKPPPLFCRCLCYMETLLAEWEINWSDIHFASLLVEKRMKICSTYAVESKFIVNAEEKKIQFKPHLEWTLKTKLNN